MDSGNVNEGGPYALRMHLANEPATSEKHQFIDTLESLLDGQISANEAAQTIANIYNPLLIASHEAELNLCYVFNIISTLTTDFADVRAQRLAEFLVALHLLPDLCDAHGTVVQVKGHTVWRDLPGWGLEFHEWGIDWVYDSAKQAQLLLNAMTFAAHVLAALPAGSFNECGTMAFYASIALEDGLERTQSTDSIPAWRLSVKPAAIWLLIASEKIHELCFRDIPEKDQRVVMYQQWKSTFCEERWAAWKLRLQELTQGSTLHEESRDLASRAVERMEQLDGITHASSIE